MQRIQVLLKIEEAITNSGENGLMVHLATQQQIPIATPEPQSITKTDFISAIPFE